MTDAMSRSMRSDSSGVERVVSRSPDLPLPWTFERHYIVGAEDGFGALPRIGPAAVGADLQGNLFVLVASARRVIVFDSSGRLTRSMGGPGGAGGEFRAPETLTVSPTGEVSVFDWGKDGFVRFTAHGDPLPDWIFPYQPITTTQQRYAANTDDAWVVATSMRTAQGRSAALLRVTANRTQPLRRLPLPDARALTYRGCGGSLDLTPLFWPELVWDASGRHIAINAGPEYAVLLLENGRAVRSIRRSMQPVAATRELALQELGAGLRVDVSALPCTIPPYDLVQQRGFAKTIPLIEHVRLSPEGEVWVQRATLGPNTSGPIDIFDATGEYIGTLPANSRLPLVFLPNRRAALLQTDEHGNSIIEIVRINRSILIPTRRLEPLAPRKEARVGSGCPPAITHPTGAHSNPYPGPNPHPTPNPA
jgi:hypothetical protein